MGRATFEGEAYCVDGADAASSRSFDDGSEVCVVRWGGVLREAKERATKARMDAPHARKRGRAIFVPLGS